MYILGLFSYKYPEENRKNDKSPHATKLELCTGPKCLVYAWTLISYAILCYSITIIGAVVYCIKMKKCNHPNPSAVQMSRPGAICQRRAASQIKASRTPPPLAHSMILSPNRDSLTRPPRSFQQAANIAPEQPHKLPRGPRNNRKWPQAGPRSPEAQPRGSQEAPGRTPEGNRTSKFEQFL